MRRVRAAILLSAMAATALIGFYAVHFREHPYRTFVRPDGRYHLVVYRRPQLLGMMPGQSSDAPGRLEITDSSGRIVGGAPLEMVQLADIVLWEPRSVRIPAVGIWSLPD
jgi:hypothetical protein